MARPSRRPKGTLASLASFVLFGGGDFSREVAPAPAPEAPPEKEGLLLPAPADLADRPVHPTVAALEALDARLVAKGWPAISPTWWEWIREVYAHPRVRTIVPRAGRRGGKSTTGCRLAVAEALHGEWNIPHGDTGICAIVSVNKKEATARLHTIEQILRALDYKQVRDPKEVREYSATAEEIRILVARGEEGELTPITFRVYAATIKGVVGFTAIFVWLDEVSRWSDPDTGANPAREVYASIKPTLLSQPSSRVWLASSPLSTLDLHFDMFAAGDSESQRVFHAPTWILNPTITEQDTHDLEPDPLYWEREYKAVPTASTVSGLFDGGLLDEAAARKVEACDTFCAGADFGFTRNASAIAIVGFDEREGRVALRRIEARRAAPGAPLRPTQTVSEFAVIAREHECATMVADVHYQELVDEVLSRHGVTRLPAPAHPIDSAKLFRRLLTDSKIALWGIPPTVLRQLKQVELVITASGSETIRLPVEGRMHADETAALLAAVWGLDRVAGGAVDRCLTLLPRRFEAGHSEPDDEPGDDAPGEREWQ